MPQSKLSRCGCTVPTAPESGVYPASRPPSPAKKLGLLRPSLDVYPVLGVGTRSWWFSWPDPYPSVLADPRLAVLLAVELGLPSEAENSL